MMKAPLKCGLTIFFSFFLFSLPTAKEQSMDSFGRIQDILEGRVI